MTSRATARHRAPLRPATPLSTVSAAVSGGVSQMGRGSVVAAMSTGLIATFGLPGSQAHPARADTPAQAAVRPVAALASSEQVAAGILGSSLSQTGVTVAPRANVTFETAAFKAVPKPTPKKTQAPKESRQAPVSRSTQRSLSTTTSAPATPPGSAKGASVLSIAARYVGVPYLYGGTTPSGFDCSGYVKYVFAAVGISLPRTANQQMNATTRISAADARPGDLVFFVSGGSAYHNGIYAGNGMMYDSPKTGGYVSKRAIWSATIVYTRVTG